jgi:broad specificity phosphatase PhoE
MTAGQIDLHPPAATEVFLILHEHHVRPPELEYEYATGRLRNDLEHRKFGEPLSQKSVKRLRELGALLKDRQLRKIITDDFIITRETARHLAAGAGLDHAAIVRLDSRVRESDLSYLGADQFRKLGDIEGAGEANAALLHWMTHRPDDFDALRRGHVELWNESLRSFAGGRYLFVLHVEGILLFTALSLGLASSAMHRLLVPRNCPVHISLAPNRDPIVCICDMETWMGVDASPYARYG